MFLNPIFLILELLTELKNPPPVTAEFSSEEYVFVTSVIKYPLPFNSLPIKDSSNSLSLIPAKLRSFINIIFDTELFLTASRNSCAVFTTV